MKKPEHLALLASGVLFLIFLANVAIGASGAKPVLSDVQEMLTMFASSVLFAIAVLCMESARSKENT